MAGDKSTIRDGIDGVGTIVTVPESNDVAARPVPVSNILSPVVGEKVPRSAVEVRPAVRAVSKKSWTDAAEPKACSASANGWAGMSNSTMRGRTSGSGTTDG